MMLPNLLISLSDNEKRFIFAIVLVVLVAFVIIGLIGSFIVRIMKWQSRRMDTLVHDVVTTRVVTTGKHLRSYGRKKNWRCFFKQAWAPFLILLINLGFILIYESIVGWNYNPFDKEVGFGSLFFELQYAEDEWVSWGLLAWRKILVTHYPTFVIEAWPGYVFATLLIFGGTWYLITIQCLIARTIKLYLLSKKLDEKTLDGFFEPSNVSNPNK